MLTLLHQSLQEESFGVTSEGKVEALVLAPLQLEVATSQQAYLP